MAALSTRAGRQEAPGTERCLPELLTAAGPAMVPRPRLTRSLLVSWALHGALIAAVAIGPFGGFEPPSVTIFELAGAVDAGPAAPGAPVPAASPRPRPLASPAPIPTPVLTPAPAASGPEAAMPSDDQPVPRSAALAPEPEAVSAPDATAATSTPGTGAGAASARHAEAAASAPDARGDEQGGGAAGTPGGELSAPRGVYQTPPHYPESARRAGVQGTALLKARILTDGTVGRVLVNQSSGNAELDAAALEAVAGWRFMPARRGGEPVELWIVVPIRFRLG